MPITDEDFSKYIALYNLNDAQKHILKVISKESEDRAIFNVLDRTKRTLEEKIGVNFLNSLKPLVEYLGYEMKKKTKN